MLFFKTNRSRIILVGIAVFAVLGTVLLTRSDAAPAIADTNGDRRVDIFDLSYMLANWNTSDPTADFVADGDVNIFDLSYMLNQWGRDDSNVPTIPLVIYDTDMGPDIDDAVALAMFHEYESLGYFELAAVTISRNSVNAARYTDALNTHYGRPDIPIGIYRGGTVDGSVANTDRYTVLAGNYAHDVHQSTIPDGYKVQRQIMAQALQQGRRLIVVQTGFSGNLSQLMDSGGDEHSSLSGIDLVTQSTESLSIMAGRFNTGQTEFNIEKDLSSARNLFVKWPVPMYVSEWNVGARVIYPYYAGIRDNLSSNHPVRRAYEHQTLSWHRQIDPNPPSNPSHYNMASWDLTSVLEAAEPDANYFNRSGPGRVNVSPSGVTTFSPGSGQHYILNLPSNTQTVINRMVDLVE